MTREEFTGVTFNNLDPSGTRISRSSEFSVVNSTEIALNTTQSSYFVNRETTDYRPMLETRKVDDNNTRKALFVSLRPLYATVMR